MLYIMQHIHYVSSFVNITFINIYFLLLTCYSPFLCITLQFSLHRRVYNFCRRLTFNSALILHCNQPLVKAVEAVCRVNSFIHYAISSVAQSWKITLGGLIQWQFQQSYQINVGQNFSQIPCPLQNNFSKYKALCKSNKVELWFSELQS